MYAKWLAYGTCPWLGRRGSEWSCKTTVNLHGQRVEPWSVLPCCSVGVLRKHINAWGPEKAVDIMNFQISPNQMPIVCLQFPPAEALPSEVRKHLVLQERSRAIGMGCCFMNLITIIFLAWPHRLEIYSILLRSFSSIYATSVDNDESLVVSTNRGSFLRVLVFSTQMMWCCLKTGFCHESLLFKVWGWCHPKFGGAQTLSI